MHHSPEELLERFGVVQTVMEATKRYNIAPSQSINVVVTDGQTDARVLDSFKWGLVPSWADDPKIGNRMINLRSETVAEKRSWDRIVTRRRCVIPSDGFFEWQAVEGGGKQPVYFRRKDGDLFGFAGLWDTWRPPDGLPLHTCTILTTSANLTVGAIHTRMPVILLPGVAEATWLDPSVTTTAALLPLLVPYPDTLLEGVPVSRRVNTPLVDDPSLIEATAV